MHVNGSAGERFDQMTLHCAEPVLAPEVNGNSSGNQIERFASFCPAIEIVAGQQSDLTLSVPARYRRRIWRHLGRSEECVEHAPIFMAAAIEMWGILWG